MSIFGTIVSKLFGKSTPPASTPAPAESALGVQAPLAAETLVTTNLLSDVDVADVMDSFVSESGQTLNWRVSIVDMMKALGIDSSLDHRKQLAKELSYGGDMNDSAAMNIWLHKQVMKALAANGGKLPAELAS